MLLHINHVLAAIPVTDIDVATRWYERLFGGPPTNNPMPSLVEWQVTSTGWVQVFVDTQRAGGSAVNLAVDGLEGAVDEMAGRGLYPGEIQDVNKGVQLSALSDPDGNTITLIGHFRESY
jgi:glyoxylase I family protein